jgi:DNA-binding CsgD family transcriptional regulator
MDIRHRTPLQKLYRLDGRSLARTMTTDRWAEVIQLPPPSERALTPLRDREIEVLQLVADGCVNREIGQRLSISEAMVKSHIRHLLARLYARNRAHAVSIAIRRRLIT